MQYTYQLILRRGDGLEESISIGSDAAHKDNLVTLIRVGNTQAAESKDNITISLYTDIVSRENQEIIVPKKEYFNFIKTLLALNIELFNNEEKKKESKVTKNNLHSFSLPQTQADSKIIIGRTPIKIKFKRPMLLKNYQLNVQCYSKRYKCDVGYRITYKGVWGFTIKAVLKSELSYVAIDEK